MDKETRNYAADIEVRDEDGKPPRITGTAVVFNSLSENLGGFRERIAPGAFDDSIDNEAVALVWNHDTSQPLARVRAGNLTLRKTSAGIHFDATPLDTTVARDAVANIRGGLVDQMSFGFFAEEDEWKTENGEEVRTVTKGRMVEISPVLFPAYVNTQAAVRSLEQRKGGTAAPATEQRGRRLAGVLNQLIDGLATDARPRASIIDEMGRAAGIDAGTVNQILGGSINCPPLARLRGFARVLGTSLARLRGAAEQDGCDYQGARDDQGGCTAEDTADQAALAREAQL